jgi:hypothetical protein
MHGGRDSRRWDDCVVCADCVSFPTPQTVQRNPNWRVCQTVRSWRRGAGRPKGATTLPTHTHLTDRLPPTPGASGHDEANHEKLLPQGCLVRPAEAHSRSRRLWPPGLTTRIIVAARYCKNTHSPCCRCCRCCRVAKSPTYLGRDPFNKL